MEKSEINMFLAHCFIILILFFAFIRSTFHLSFPFFGTTVVILLGIMLLAALGFVHYIRNERKEIIVLFYWIVLVYALLLSFIVKEVVFVGAVGAIAGIILFYYPDHKLSGKEENYENGYGTPYHETAHPTHFEVPHEELMRGLSVKAEKGKTSKRRYGQRKGKRRRSKQ